MPPTTAQGTVITKSLAQVVTLDNNRVSISQMQKKGQKRRAIRKTPARKRARAQAHASPLQTTPEVEAAPSLPPPVSQSREPDAVHPRLRIQPLSAAKGSGVLLHELCYSHLPLVHRLL